MARQARYGAVTARCQAGQLVVPVFISGGRPPILAAMAISHAATIGTHHAAAPYSRRGGSPRSHPAVSAAAATSVTGAKETANASRNATRSAPPSHR